MSYFSIAAAGVSLYQGFAGSRSAKKEAKKRAAISRAEGKFQSDAYLFNSQLDRVNAEEAMRQGRLSGEILAREFSTQAGLVKAKAGAGLGSVSSVTIDQVLEYQSKIEDEERREALRSSFTDAASFESSALNNKRLSAKALRDGESGAILVLGQGKAASQGALIGGVGSALGYGSQAWANSKKVSVQV
jgi:hypothetical protein